MSLEWVWQSSRSATASARILGIRFLAMATPRDNRFEYSLRSVARDHGVTWLQGMASTVNEGMLLVDTYFAAIANRALVHHGLAPLRLRVTSPRTRSTDRKVP